MPIIVCKSVNLDCYLDNNPESTLSVDTIAFKERPLPRRVVTRVKDSHLDGGEGKGATIF